MAKQSKGAASGRKSKKPSHQRYNARKGYKSGSRTRRKGKKWISRTAVPA